MDAETQRKIEVAVVEILKGANMEETTEFKVRSMAAEKLGLDLDLPDRKHFVRGVVESFLLSQKEEDPTEAAEERQERAGAASGGGGGVEQGREREEEEEEEEEGDKKRARGEREFDDDGDLIICRLSNRRKVTIQDFRGKTLVSIREFYEKDGKQLPSNKGISLTSDQWVTFKNAVPAIEDAIKKLQSRLN